MSIEKKPGALPYDPVEAVKRGSQKAREAAAQKAGSESETVFFRPEEVQADMDEEVRTEEAVLDFEQKAEQELAQESSLGKKTTDVDREVNRLEIQLQALERQSDHLKNEIISGAAGNDKSRLALFEQVTEQKRDVRAQLDDATKRQTAAKEKLERAIERDLLGNNKTA